MSTSLPRIHGTRTLSRDGGRVVEELDLEFSNGERRRYHRVHTSGDGAVIVVPLLLAGATQCAADRTRWGALLAEVVMGAMVPIMVLTLAVVVASQIAGVRDQLSSLLLTVPVYVLFAAVMTPVGAAAGRLAGLDVPGRRSVVFSGVTRNSLVILPLVLALPASYALAPLVVVT